MNIVCPVKSSAAPAAKQIEAMRASPRNAQAVSAPAPLPSIHELGYTLARFNFWLFGWPISLALSFFFARSAGGLRLFGSCAAVLLVYAGISAATINSSNDNT